MAGVSHSTVSRALRNSPLIPSRTAQRIQRIASEAGYSASAVARSLVTRKTFALGVVVTSIADPFNGEVVNGIEEVANRHGYSVILANSQADPAREVTVVRSFRERRVDGVLVASSRVGALYVPLLSELQIPIVLINNQHPSEFVHSVTIDNVQGAYDIAQHLIQLGHKKIAYLGDRFGLQSDAERFSGFEKAMKESGLPIGEGLVVHGDGKPQGAMRAARDLLSRPDPPTAIVCYNDMSALGVLQEAESMRLAVPGDLSVAGFDDIFFASLLKPPLTTVQQPKRQIGERAAELLLALLEGKEAEKTVVIRGELVARGSTAEPRNSRRKLSSTNRSSRGRTPRPDPRNTA